MGLEAVSRGAEVAVMVERDRRIFELLEKNIDSLGCSEQVSAVCADALGSIPLLRAPKPVDVAFIDPPFVMMQDESLRERILQQIANIEPLLSKDGFIVLRTPIDPKRTDHSVPVLSGPEIHKLGSNMWISFYGNKNI
jgi:16S rRNA (guanine966-N2)-methyltransferase